MPRACLAHEATHALTPLAQQAAGVGVEVERPLRHRHDHRRIGGRTERHCVRGKARVLLANRLEQSLHRKPTGSGRGQRGPVVAIGPGDQLPFVREQHAGHRHQQDHEAGSHAGNEVGPEDKSA